jgi:hypothetical protein
LPSSSACFKSSMLESILHIAPFRLPSGRRSLFGEPVKARLVLVSLSSFLRFGFALCLPIKSSFMGDSPASTVVVEAWAFALLPHLVKLHA